MLRSQWPVFFGGSQGDAVAARGLCSERSEVSPHEVDRTFVVLFADIRLDQFL